MDRKKALDQLRAMQAWHEDFGNGPCPDYDAICYAIGVIEAQPEELDTLVKALEKEHQRLLEMQKAQPEIIRCKDCQHSEYDEVYGDRYCHYNGKAEVVDDYHFCRDGEKKHDDVTCENCEYSEKYTDGLILCRRTKTSHRVSATSTCGKGKRER